MPKGVFERRRRKVEIPIGPSIAYVPLTQGQYALIDRGDAEEIGKYNWFAVWCADTRSFYAKRARRKTESLSLPAIIPMQSCVCPTPVGMIGDHINGFTLDNRRSNARPASPRDNVRNSRLRVTSNSRLKGVSWSAQNRRWRASISAGGRWMHLGYFRSKERAHAAYCRAAVEHHGEFARVA